MRRLYAILISSLFFIAFAIAQPPNTSIVNQTGTSNDAVVSQTGTGHTGNVDQFGKNIADIMQSGGSNNEAYITQGSASTPVTNSGPNGPGNWKYGAFIEQIGSDNDATQTVRTSDNGISIYQEGNTNAAVQDVFAKIHKTTNWNRMGLEIDQIGDNNYAKQETHPGFGVFGVQGMAVYQTGDLNVATQYSKGGAYNTVEIWQVGDNNNNPSASGNVFDVSATGLSSPLDLPWADKPAGDYTQYVNAYKGKAHMSISGNDNNAAQYQEYTVHAAGGDNDAWLDLSGDMNNVAQGQLGEYNDSDIDIVGSGNVVATSQNGDNNFADIDLVGTSDNNVVGVQQIGNGHSSTVMQNGATNFAKIIQQ